MKQSQEPIIQKSLIYTLSAPFILAIATIITYISSLHYDFQFDDLASIPKHFFIRHYNFSQLFFSGTRWISYWLNSLYYKVDKFNPFVYRLGNVTIHTINGLLIFFILFIALSRLRKHSFFKQYSFELAFITALLFLLHPVQTQTISYVIQGQLEGLAALFALSMILSFLQFSYASHIVVRIASLCLLFVATIFSCGTKEIAIISPMLVMLCDWFFVAQGSWQSFKQRLVVHISLLLIVLGIYTYLLKPTFFTNILGFKLTSKNNIGNVITSSPQEIITPSYFFISQFKVILHYLWIFIWPLNISVEYDWKLAEHFFAPDCLFPFLILSTLFGSIVRLLWYNVAHLIAFGALWFALCITPRSSIIPSPELLVDYKTYLASFGWLFLLAAGLLYGILWLQRKITTSHSRYAYIPFMLLFCILGFLTHERNKIWHSGLEFWENMIQNAPGKARAYNNYGVELSQKLYKYNESIPYFKKAIAMDHFYPDPWHNLAVAYASMGKIDEAIDAIKCGLNINPYYAEGYNNLASFCLMKKDYDQAKIALQEALKYRKYYGKAYINMGRLHLDQGNNLAAWECFRMACMEADMDNEVGFGAFGHVSLMVKKFDDAIFAYRKVLEIKPYDNEAMFNLGNAYFLSGKHQQALPVYESAYRNNSYDLRIWYNLGETHFMLNNIEKARIFFEQVKTAPDHPLPVYGRLIECYAKQGNVEQAKQCLYEFNQLDDPDKGNMQSSLEKLKKQYKLG